MIWAVEKNLPEEKAGMDVAKRKFEKVLCLPGMVGRV